MGNIPLIVILLSIVVTLCSAKCGQVLENKISEADKQSIVNTHNYLRSLISNGRVPGQPKGKNLKTMRWDDRLAKQAQKIANTCEFRHVKVKDDRFYVGQNLAWSSSTGSTPGANFTHFIHGWFNEYRKFKYPNRSTGVTGHYTQVVWADTYLVGCGYTWYRQTPTSWFEKLYVCNYGPGGNYVGVAPYKI